MAQLMLKGGKVFFLVVVVVVLYTLRIQIFCSRWERAYPMKVFFSFIFDRPWQEFANEQQLHK